jgi:hypothetical protein
MQRQRAQRSAMPVPVRQRATPDNASTDYGLIVDGLRKAEFKTHENALEAAKDLKRRFPRLLVKVFNPETKLSETIDLAAA